MFENKIVILIATHKYLGRLLIKNSKPRYNHFNMQVSNYSILDAKFPRIGNIGKNIKINYSEG